jgi:uncharacterized membrane protein
MKRITYLFCALIIACATAALTAVSIVFGNFFVPLIAIPAGVLVIWVCRRNVSEVFEDELSQRISGKAAMRTLEAMFIIGAIVGTVLLSVLGNGPSYGGQIIDNNGTVSEKITMYRHGGEPIPENAIKSLTIRDRNAMTEEEARAYCSFWRDDLWFYNFSGHASFVILTGVVVMVTCFSAFYLYYRKKYGT